MNMGTNNYFLAVLIGAIFFPLQMFAWGTEINGIYYSFDTENKTACVVSGHGVFEDGVKLQYYSGNIVIPEEVTYEGITYKVTSIEGGRESGGMPYNDGAFEYSSITSIQIPKTIERIGEYTFQGCSSLATVSFDGNIKSIGIGAFKDCCSLVSFEIPEGVESLSNEIFKGCSSLESLTIPTTLKSSGYSGDFVKLKSLHIKDLVAWCNVSFYSSDGNPLYYAHHLFLKGEEVTELEIPQETTVVGNYVFSGCEGITSVEFHKGVESIGVGCFANCKNLETITIKGNGPKIEDVAFYRCSKLKDIYCDTEKCPAHDNYNPDIFDESTYENATLHVKDYAVESFKADLVWSLFKKIDVEKVTDFKLSYYVDGEIYKTEQHKYGDEITPEPNPIKKGMTFSGWSDIPATMPGKDVTATGTFSWSEVTKNGVIYQVYNAEDELAAVIGCDNASSDVMIISPVEIDGYKYSVTDIVDFVFKNNTDITSVVIPESVRKIGDEAFYGCKNLAKIELGKSMNQIESRAFTGIDKLVDVTIYAEDVPSTDRTAFENSYIEDYVTLYVPAGSLEKYKAEAPWKNFKEIVAIEGTETELVKYSLIYQLDGDTYQKYELEEGAEITPLEAPTKEGYTFSGWSEIPETMPANDLVIKGTFTENIEDNTEKDEIKIGNIGKTTYCSEYDLDFTNVVGIKAYTATGYDNKSKTIWLTRVLTVPAGTGILIKGDAGTYKIPRSTEDAYYTNMFKGNTGDPIKIEETEGDMTNYYLSGKDGSFVSVNGSANIDKNKAYLQLPTRFFAGTRSIGVIYDDEGTTGIRTVEQGTLNTERDVWFNMQGQRVDKPSKGLYIRNGKKVFIIGTN